MSIKELGIGADIDRPEDFRHMRDTTYKTRDFRPDQDRRVVAVQVKRQGIMVTPESILKHEQHINAIMISLKPTFKSYFFNTIRKDDLKKFFNRIREE